MERENTPDGKSPAEMSTDAQPLTDAAAEAAAGGMCVNHTAFLKWASTHDEKGNEIDPQTGQVIKAAGR